MKQILITSLLIVAYFLLNIPTSFAQTEEDTTTVVFIAYWHKGETRNYEITKVKRKWKNEKIQSVDSVKYMAKFEVTDSTATSYTIKWTYKNDLFQFYHLPEKSIKKLSKYKDVEVIYKTDELGTFVEIENWKEISTMTKKVFEELFQTLEIETERKKLKQKMQPIMMAYNTKQGIEQLFLKELQIFHLPLGGEFDITEPIVYEEELPNLFSKGFIKGDGLLTFEEVNREEGYCIFSQQLKLNPEDSKKMIVDAFKKMNLLESDFEKELKNSFVSILDDNIYSYFYGYGLPAELITNRETHIKIQDEEMRQIEKMIVKLIFD